MSCDCQISAELQIELRKLDVAVKFHVGELSCKSVVAAVKFHVGELRIELQKLDAAAIYIYISPFIITQICGSCNFMKLSNFLPPAF